MKRKIKIIVNILRRLHKTIYFNFHYLPFKEALKLPIVFFSNVRLMGVKGQIKLSGPVKPAMIRIGVDGNVLYDQHKNCIVWANYGGTVELGDKIIISQGCAFEIGERANLTLRNDILFGPFCRLACYDQICIEEHSRIAWESILMDTDFHSTINIVTGERSPLTKPIHIGKNNWIGVRCMVMKGTVTPHFCIASGYSMLNKHYEIPSYSIIGGIPAKFLKEGYYRDLYSHVNEKEQERYSKTVIPENQLRDRIT